MRFRVPKILCVALAMPVNDTVMEYVPGASMAKWKRLLTSVVVVARQPLAVFASATSAPAMRAPLRSSTNPCSEVLPSCDRAGSSNTNTSAGSDSARRISERR